MNDKIILESNKISVSKNSGNKVNEKLKQLQRMNIKRELTNLKPKEVEEEALNTNELLFNSIKDNVNKMLVENPEIDEE